MEARISLVSSWFKLVENEGRLSEKGLNVMTEKEFRKLRRRDLLQLLVAQGKENIQLQEELDTTKGELAQSQESNEKLKARLDEKDLHFQESNERLKAKLDEKDARFQESNERLKAKLNEKDILIEKLKGRLDQKDARIHELREQMEHWLNSRRIELEDAGSIAEAALRLNGIFEVAQQAAEQYLYNIRVNRGLEKSDLLYEMKLEPEPKDEPLEEPAPLEEIEWESDEDEKPDPKPEPKEQPEERKTCEPEDK